MGPARRAPDRPACMRFSIGLKLAAAFGAVLLITLALGLLGQKEIRTVTSHAMHINDETVPSVSHIDDVALNIEIFRQDQFRHVASDDEAAIEDAMVAD